MSICRNSFLHLIATALVLLSSASVLAQTSQDRTVKKASRQNEPVQIIAIKVKGKAVEFGKPFMAEDDWIGGLTLTVKNTSAKTVSWVRVALVIDRGKEPDLRLTDHMAYGVGPSDVEKLLGGGRPLRPGETAEAVFHVEDYEGLRELLDDMDYPQSIASIEVSVEQVSFAGEEDVMWIEGQMNRKDAHSRSGWTPIKQ